MYVFGNGESRKQINLDTLQGYKIGCNAIIRDYQVDELVCVDRRMVEEAIRIGANNNCKIYTRKDWIKRFANVSNINEVPNLPYKSNLREDEPIHWGSGPYAILIAVNNLTSFSDQLNREINLIGFDLYSKTKFVNNIYKDTDSYGKSNSKSIDPRYWIHQIGKIIELFPFIKFNVYQSNHWALPTAWNKPNCELHNISSLL